MANGVIPNTDAGLLAFTQNVSRVLGTSPESMGETIASAAAYADVQAAFAMALATAQEPSTRTRITVGEKRAAAKNLRKATGQIAKRIAGYPPITESQLLSLGFNVRKRPTPIEAPTVAPALRLVKVTGNTATFLLQDAAVPDSRRKPDGVASAVAFSHVGPDKPADPKAWEYRGGVTRNTFDLVFDPALPMGTEVFVTCCWRNERDMAGPACPPVSATLLGTGALPSGGDASALRIAA